MTTKYLEVYDNTKTYVLPNGVQASPNTLMANYSVLNAGTCYVETNSTGLKFYAVDLAEDWRNRYDIDDALPDAEAIKAIETAMNTIVVQEPSAEERVASALEYQNLLATVAQTTTTV